MRSTSCGARAAGDVLVFLPGEREIREAAEHLRKHHPPGRRDPAAVRAPVAAGAGPRVRAARRAAHRARDQRRRDLADGARHPLRGRSAASRASSATATATRSSSCRSSRSARPRPTSAPGAAAASPTASASGSTTKHDFAGAAALHRPRDPALVAGRRDPAHEVAAPGRRRGLPVPRAAAAQGDRRRLRSCSPSWARSTSATS